MTITELRSTLAEMAGPLDPPTSSERQAVRRRLRRHRIVGTIAALAALVLVIAGVAAVALERNDGAERIATGSGTTVHNEERGFTATVPPDWRVVDVDAAAGDSLPSLLQARFAFRLPAIDSQLQTIGASRQVLTGRLATLPVDSPERNEIHDKLDALNREEAELRSDPTPDCGSGVGLTIQEINPRQTAGTPDALETPTRPKAFGPDSGQTRNVQSAACGRFFQWIGFRDQGRTFLTSITAAPGTDPRRIDEAYGILDSLVVDPDPELRPAPSDVSTTSTTVTTVAAPG